MIYNDHLGYYLYDNKMYLTREAALDDMLLKKDYTGEIQFYYNDDVFTKIDWKINIPFSISDLYRLRAQQLRDKYKYLILRYSGGSDSTQALESFLKNNILLDEIIVVNHQKAINNLDRNQMAKDPHLAEFLEYEYAVIPQLKRVKELSPNTKITLLDTSDNLVNQLVNNRYEHLGRNDEPRALRYVVGSLPKNWTPVLLKHEQETTTRDGVAIIRGLEKPVVNIKKDRSMFFSFYDITLTATVSMQKHGTSYTIEDFYWSRDFPLIPIKQSQMIIEKLSSSAKLFSKYIALRNLILLAASDSKIKSSPGYILDRWYNTIIYPDWNPKTFVAPKPTIISAEFKLVEALGMKHNANEFTDEFYNYKSYKYDKIVNKKQLSKYIFTKPIYLGQFQPKFKLKF